MLYSTATRRLTEVGIPVVVGAVEVLLQPVEHNKSIRMTSDKSPALYQVGAQMTPAARRHLERAQACCHVPRAAQIHHEVAVRVSGRLGMLIVLIIRLLHLRTITCVQSDSVESVMHSRAFRYDSKQYDLMLRHACLHADCGLARAPPSK